MNTHEAKPTVVKGKYTIVLLNPCCLGNNSQSGECKLWQGQEEPSL